VDHTFLHALNDTTGNVYLFGKLEKEVPKSFLEKLQVNDSVDVQAGNYIQLYKGHALKPVNPSALNRKNVMPDWFFPLILIVLLVYTWLRIFYSKFFSQMINAFINTNLANQIVRDENIFIQRASVYLSIVFNLILALMLYLVSIHFEWEMGGIDAGFSRYIFFVIIVSAAYALKFLTLKICGWLFEQEREMATYVFYIFLINNILGMALLPFICIFAYNENLSFSWLLAIPLILTVLAYCWRIFRGLQIGLGISPFSPLYIFLYLCALEFAPLMILLRVVIQ
jgi:hypothetical protein